MIQTTNQDWLKASFRFQIGIPLLFTVPFQTSNMYRSFAAVLSAKLIKLIILDPHNLGKYPNIHHMANEETPFVLMVPSRAMRSYRYYDRMSSETNGVPVGRWATPPIGKKISSDWIILPNMVEMFSKKWFLTSIATLCMREVLLETRVFVTVWLK